MVEKLNKTQWFAVSFLILTHIAGIVGLQHPEFSEIFRRLTATNLLVTGIILFLFHEDWNTEFITFAVVTLLVGYFVEVLGVKTGFIFGEYSYGPTLGFKLLEVPLIIGLNWLILVYSSNMLLEPLELSPGAKALIASATMVLLDNFIEPVAIALDFWSWEAADVPIQNYLAWFVIAFILSLIYQRADFKKQNPVAIYLIMIYGLFFIALWLFML